MSVFPTAPIESPTDAQPLATSATSVFSFAPGRLRAWGLKSALSLVDQGLTSAAGFGVNLLLARWLAPDLYGAFAVAFAAFLFISGFHNVLLLEPLSVMGPSRHAGRLPEYFRAQMAVHGILVGVLSLIALVMGLILWRLAPGSPLVGSVLGSAFVLSLLLLLWLARRMCYVMQSPGIAVAGSAIYFVLVIAGLFALRFAGKVSPLGAFLLMGASSLFVTWILLHRLGVKSTGTLLQVSISWRAVLRENWAYGRWLTLTTALSWTLIQAQTFLAAGFLGLSAAGTLRAMQLPSLAMTQVIAATTLLVLPSMSQELGRGNIGRLRKKAMLSTMFLTTLGSFFVAGLFLFAAPIEGLLFGQKYSSFAWLIPVLGLVPIFTGFSSSLSLALRALRKSQFELLAYVLSAITALASGYVLMPRWGLPGAAASIVGSTGVLAIGVLICFLKWGKE
jgi:O-antigen/teichoic acid export membrane protein